MLDQNTDRMWYVIGAVIVGAALIFLVNSSFPQLFASVGDTFKDKTESVGEVVSGLSPNMQTTYIKGSDVQLSHYPVKASMVAYNADDASWEVSVEPDATGWSGGLSVQEGVVEIPYGKTFTLSYEVYVPVDTHASNDGNNTPVTGSPWGIHANDNDNPANREGLPVLMSDIKDNILPQNLIKANEWKTIKFSYTNDNPLNVNKTALFDYSTFGANNPTTKNITIKIRNVHTVVK